MSLFQQIQVFLGTIALTMIFMALYGAFNRLFYRWHGKMMRLLVEIPFFLLLAYIYFRFLVWICHAQLNIHYILAIGIGAFLYQRFYAFSINLYYEKIARFLNRKIFSPIHRFFSRYYAIIKKRWKWGKKHGKRNQKKSNI